MQGTRLSDSEKSFPADIIERGLYMAKSLLVGDEHPQLDLLEKLGSRVDFEVFRGVWGYPRKVVVKFGDIEMIQNEFDAYQSVNATDATPTPAPGCYGLFRCTNNPNRGFLILENFGDLFGKSFLALHKDMKQVILYGSLL